MTEDAPTLPEWLHPPKGLEADKMLAMDAILSAAFGRGHSIAAFGSDLPMRLVVFPIPGVLPADREGRTAAADTAIAEIEAAIGHRVRMTVWNDSEPAHAFDGMMAGTVVREGWKEIGVARGRSYAADLDDF